VGGGAGGEQKLPAEHGAARAGVAGQEEAGGPGRGEVSRRGSLANFGGWVPGEAAAREVEAPSLEALLFGRPVCL